MDLLQEYEKNQPKAQFSSTLPAEGQLLAQRYAPDAGFFVRLVIKLAGGRIENTRQASLILLGTVISIFVISLFVFLFSFSGGLGIVAPPKINVNP
ncbi:MAG: hypothetical protein HY006_03090 [Candidatus Sungbacteria bacterium]|nr:hypothetical protein [Candidatus Sungbacteria bacterium]